MVLGAGFGGLTFCQRFSHPDFRLTVVDRQNHHLFQPLLYQVATAGLSAPDIAEPVRGILRGRQDITIRLGTVVGIRPGERRVLLQDSQLEYDYLVFALGGVTSYFGHPEWEQHAPGLKSLEDALRIRRDVLLAFERAENETDEARRAAWMTVVVVGGGPTGVELAGAFAELTTHVLRRDFRQIDPRQARVILIEAGPRVLAHLPPALSESAARQLKRLGVELRLNQFVRHLSEGRVELADGTVIAAGNLIWAAGVAAHPLTRELGIELDRAGRVKVTPDLSLPDHPEVFVIGDAALVVGPDGRPVPGVSPAAMQMAGHVARIIRTEAASTKGRAGERPAFRYRDKGTMATIGRSAAVAKIGRLEFSGFPAWLAWLFVHLMFLVGFDNKAVVFFNWLYAYVTYQRGARIIIGTDRGGSQAARPTPGIVG